MLWKRLLCPRVPVPGTSFVGNGNNNNLYGTQNDDTLDGGAGNDYLRGYGGDDLLIGGTGIDRILFERTWAANGIDIIMDYSFSDGDILDLSLLVFARGVFSREPLNNILRLQQGSGNEAMFLISLDGTPENFETWAVLKNMPVGSSANVAVAATTYVITVV